MPAMPDSAVALDGDRETAIKLLSALIAALRASRPMRALLMPSKLYAPFRKLIENLHQWITSLS